MTDRTIRAATTFGIDDLPTLCQVTGAGLSCGGCHEALAELLAEGAAAASQPTGHHAA